MYDGNAAPVAVCHDKHNMVVKQRQKWRHEPGAFTWYGKTAMDVLTPAGFLLSKAKDFFLARIPSSDYNLFITSVSIGSDVSYPQIYCF